MLHYLREVVTMLLAVDWPLQRLQVGHILLDGGVLVASVHIVHWVVEAP